MDKRIYNLFIKQQRSIAQNQQLIQFISNKYFKSLITLLPLQTILSSIIIQQWPSQHTIFHQGDKLQHYYFLIQGSINLYKKNNFSQQEILQIVKNVSGSSIIGDSFFSHNITRSCTAITNDSTECKGFILSKSVFNQLCGNLIKQYKIIRNYFCNFLKISIDKLHPTDLYQNITIKRYKYGQKITTQNRIYIIYEGQCLISFQQKQKQKQNQKSKNNSPYQAKNIKLQSYRPLLKLCTNDCFGMQNIPTSTYQSQQTNYKSSLTKFKYISTSQILTCIQIDCNKLNLFPNELTQKLKIIHNSHLQKLQNNINFKNISLNSSRSYSTLGDYNDMSVPKLISSNFMHNYHHNSINNSLLLQSSQNNSIIMNNNQSPNILISDVTNTIQSIKPKFIPLNRQKSQTQKVKSKQNKKQGRYYLPKVNLNIKNNLSKQKLQQQYSYCFRLNKTQNLSQSQSPIKIINKNDIYQLKKKYCIGYDLKNKCDKQSIFYKNKDQQQQNINKQPHGYFQFNKRYKNKIQKNCYNNQNKFKKQRNTHNPKSKQWSYYLKLPNIVPKICTNMEKQY